MPTLREEIVSCAGPQVRTLEAGRGYELTFRFSKDFTGFRGHFPQHPILPAFVQLLLGQCAVERRTDRPWSLCQVERSKFLKVIPPEQPVTLSWQEQPVTDGLRCSFSLAVNGEKAAVFTLGLSAEESHHA
jgi:3-hydroxymyristoyl/3-hydroxydecanoyl-(acyl carrier protein) dehydratase